MTEKWDNIKISANKQALDQYVAERIVRLATATLEVNETFSLVLAGGSTPQPVYEKLAQKFDRFLDWSRIHLFFGDERCVPPDDEQSNYRMVKEALLDHIDIPEANVHRIKGEDDPQAAADAYEAEIKAFFGEDKQTFDLTLLGMGEDGHTASLFPYTDAVFEEDRRVIAHHVEVKGNLWRVSLTFPAILSSSNIMFMISGAKKSDLLHAVLDADYEPDRYPTQMIARSDHPHIVWAIDQEAGQYLPVDQ